LYLINIFADPKKLSKNDLDGNNGIPLPHNDEITIYDSGGRLPSLMGGSQQEWERLANVLIDLAY
jgi:hypothetical protein